MPPDSAHPHEIELARRVASGEFAAFDELANSVRPRLMKYSLLVCGQAEDAEDIVQETLLRAYASAGELRDPERVHAWFFRIAKNACLMRRRHDIGARATDCIDEHPSLPDADADPEAAVLATESITALRDAIGELPWDYRMVVVLRCLEGLSTEQTAEAIEVSPELVRARLHRARLSLRRKLDE